MWSVIEHSEENLQITHEKLAIRILLNFLLPQPVPTRHQCYQFCVKNLLFSVWLTDYSNKYYGCMWPGICVCCLRSLWVQLPYLVVMVANMLVVPRVLTLWLRTTEAM